MRANKSEVLRKIVISAMFLALATVFKVLFSFYLTIFGANGIKIGISGIFTVLPAVLFGPMYGAAVGGLTDFLGWALRPDGPYIPLLTVTAALGGFIQGYLWRVIRKKADSVLRISATCFFAMIGIYGVITHIALKSDGLMNGFYASPASSLTKETVDSIVSSEGLSFPSSLVVALNQYSSVEDYASDFALYANMLTIGLEFIALVGIVVISLDLILRKRIALKGDTSENSIQPFKFVFIMITAGIIVTTLNTPVLQLYFPALMDKAFILLWIPRVVEEVISRAVQAYVVAVLYTVYVKSIQPKITKVISKDQYSV